jgi:hypothetical protein
LCDREADLGDIEYSGVLPSVNLYHPEAEKVFNPNETNLKKPGKECTQLCKPYRVEKILCTPS